jgi:hypothetical protein
MHYFERYMTSVITLCNENQPDALFILNLFRQSASTCFGHVYCPSSGGIPCINTAIGTCYTFRLTGCWLGQDGTFTVYVQQLVRVMCLS